MKQNLLIWADFNEFKRLPQGRLPCQKIIPAGQIFQNCPLKSFCVLPTLLGQMTTGHKHWTLDVKTSKTRNKPKNTFKWVMAIQALPPSPKRARWSFFQRSKFKDILQNQVQIDKNDGNDDHDDENEQRSERRTYFSL